eukprot:GHVU01216015.1.p1 GENE.GHVU01216015.1~~GHVU01216015.1.p1  ORF type:complete len:208 (+),score=5.72 GHVU01216015.1:422-1045(+)
MCIVSPSPDRLQTCCVSTTAVTRSQDTYASSFSLDPPACAIFLVSAEPPSNGSRVRQTYPSPRVTSTGSGNTQRHTSRSSSQSQRWQGHDHRPSRRDGIHGASGRTTSRGDGHRPTPSAGKDSRSSKTYDQIAKQKHSEKESIGGKPTASTGYSTFSYKRPLRSAEGSPIDSRRPRDEKRHQDDQRNGKTARKCDCTGIESLHIIIL